MTNEELAQSLRTRANIRRNATTRKSVQEGKPDRLAALLDLAAERLEQRLEEVGTVVSASDGWPWKSLMCTNEQAMYALPVGTPVDALTKTDET